MYNYIIRGESYDRGPGGPLSIKFEADDDRAAQAKMVAIAFSSSGDQELMALTNYNRIMDYLATLVLDEDEAVVAGDEWEDEVMEAFEDINGDGMDYFAALKNLDTGDIVWGDPEDANLVNFDYDDEEEMDWDPYDIDYA